MKLAEKLIKNCLLMLCLFIFFVNPAMAACDYTNQCPAAPYDLASDSANFFFNATGATFLAEQIAKNQIQQELKKATKKDFDVEIKAFNPKSLLEGKFKYFSITGKNLIMQRVS